MMPLCQLPMCPKDAKDRGSGCIHHKCKLQALESICLLLLMLSSASFHIMACILVNDFNQFLELLFLIHLCMTAITIVWSVCRVSFGTDHFCRSQVLSNPEKIVTPRCHVLLEADRWHNADAE